MGEARRRQQLPRIARNIPSLDAWIGDVKAEGFIDFVDRMAKASDAALKVHGEDTARLSRLLKTQLIAVMESIREEHARGHDAATSLLGLSRCMGAAAIYFLAGCGDETSPPCREAVPILLEEFREGLKLAADQIEDAEHG